MYFVIWELNGKQIFKSEWLDLKSAMEFLDRKVVTDNDTIWYKYFIEKDWKQSLKFPTMRIVERQWDKDKYYQIEYNSNSMFYEDIE